MKLHDAVVLFEQESGRLRTEASRKSFRKVMNHLEGQIGIGCNVGDVTPRALTDWCLMNNPAPSTVKKRRGHARSFFGWCTYRGWIRSDPSAGLNYSVIPGRGSVRQHTWLDKAQLVNVLRAMPDDEIGKRDSLIVLLGSLCGLRADEICGLRWSSFSADLSTVSLIGKGNKPATVAVPPELRSRLQEWRDEHRPVSAVAVIPSVRWAGQAGTSMSERACNWDQPLEYHGVLYAVKAAGKRAGVELRPHDLRRTFAGILEDSGVPVTDIQRAMRHGDVGTTSRYLAKNPAKTVAVTEGLTIGL